MGEGEQRVRARRRVLSRDGRSVHGRRWLAVNAPRRAHTGRDGTPIGQEIGRAQGLLTGTVGGPKLHGRWREGRADVMTNRRHY